MSSINNQSPFLGNLRVPSDVLLTDSSEVLFVGRDNGTTFTFFRLDTLAAYTPVGTISAAGGGGSSGPSIFSPASVGNTQSLAVTSSNGQITFTSGDITANSLRIFNSGTVPVFIRWGTGAQTAVATTDLPVAPGSVEVFNKSGASGFAAITASGTATIYVTPGSGA